MDLNLPVTYRGLDLTGSLQGPGGRPLRGCMLDQVNYAEVVGEGYREKRALDDGYDAGSVWLGFRPVELRGKMFGETLADLWDRMQVLRATLTPTLAYADEPGDLGFMPLAFSQRTAKITDWASGIIPLEILVRPQGQPRFIVDNDRLSGKTEYGFVIEWTAQLWARDPRIYVQTPQEDLFSGASGSGNMPNRGDYPAPLNFLLNVAAGGAQRVFRFTGVGSAFNVTIPTSANPRLVRVDSSLKVVTYEEDTGSGTPVEILRMDLIDFDAGLTWPRVPTVATSPYTWTSTGGSLASGSKVWYSEALA